MFTGEVETKDDVYKELENQYNDEQRRTIQAARAANVQGAVLPGDTKDNEQRGSEAPADVGEQAEALPAATANTRVAELTSGSRTAAARPKTYYRIHNTKN